VNEIERLLWERVGANVVTDNLDVRLVDRGEEVELEVGCGPRGLLGRRVVRASG
jgi:hypothetical protein